MEYCEPSGNVDPSGPWISGRAGQALGASFSLAAPTGTQMIVPADDAQSMAECSGCSSSMTAVKSSSFCFISAVCDFSARHRLAIKELLWIEALQADSVLDVECRRAQGCNSAAGLTEG
jgi:hypothetical protein